eukprot:CAMPEP_0173199204 /NCGR_PEP_ID=MMETSP1141-20130122/17106_1 /TAXON_ID=483371 /ORGANISM="non described non described, Strain CCMP2298" /LENGTH=74 /DNA_ID=CAMNT_0014124069 /DNA_START=347 /DNA_END=571 /DNA_ORIENTATION=+
MPLCVDCYQETAVVGDSKGGDVFAVLERQSVGGLPDQVEDGDAVAHRADEAVPVGRKGEVAVAVDVAADALEAV